MTKYAKTSYWATYGFFVLRFKIIKFLFDKIFAHVTRHKIAFILKYIDFIHSIKILWAPKWTHTFFKGHSITTHI